jgi:hypothetical protein
MQRGTTAVLIVPRFLIATCVVGACGSLLDTRPGQPVGRTFVSEGIVTGFVRDSAGHGVFNVSVCATAGFADVNGTPAIVSSEAASNADGSYLVPLDLTFQADARASLTVAATPGTLTGLAPTIKSGLSVLIATKPPPAETTRVNLVVQNGSPHDGAVCALGP